jgi:uncharacterized protein
MPRGGARPNPGRKKPLTEEERVHLREKAQARYREKAKAKAAAQPAPTAASPKSDASQSIFNTVNMLSMAQRLREDQSSARLRGPDWNPYVLRDDHFGPVIHYVPKKLRMQSHKQLAQDNQFAVNAWQAGGLLSNAVSEGLLFLGYPYLAELAQRPEYRITSEIRAEEMTRKWIKFTGTKTNQNERDESREKEIEDKIKDLTDFLEHLRVRDWFKDAAAQDAFFGISHILIELTDQNVDNINDPELKTSIGNGRDERSKAKLSKGCLKGLRTIEPLWVYPTSYNAINPLRPSWYDPEVWYVMGTEVHKTRLLSLIGRPVPDMLKPAYAFGGVSMSQLALPYVNIWLKTRQSVGDIVHAYSVMVLMTNLGTQTQPGGADVIARAELFNALRDNRGLYVLDKSTEDFKNVSAQIAGLSDLQAQAQEHMFSVNRIPAVKFAGIQPKGLNATSEGEMRAFYDTVKAEQNHLFRTPLNTIIDIAMISLWGQRDEDIEWDFVELWESTAKEKAEIRKMNMEVDQIAIDAGIIWQEEARSRVANDPESGYDNIEVEDVPDLLEEEETGLIPQGAGKGLEAELAQAEGKQQDDPDDD